MPRDDGLKKKKGKSAQRREESRMTERRERQWQQRRLSRGTGSWSSLRRVSQEDGGMTEDKEEEGGVSGAAGSSELR